MILNENSRCEARVGLHSQQGTAGMKSEMKQIVDESPGGSSGHERPRPRRRRSGAVLPLVAVLMVVMLAMAAFAVDIGYISLVKSELQATVDAANFAAASGLPYGPSEVRKRAKESAAANMV